MWITAESFVIVFYITKACISAFLKTYRDAWKLRQKKRHYPVCISFLQIYSLVLQGRINDVRELLAQHPEKQPGKYDVRISLGFYYVDLQLHWAGLSLKKDQGPGARGQRPGARGQEFPLATISMTPGYILRKLVESKAEPLGVPANG